MNYLIVQQWPNTKGNHAGMSHMCDLLVKNHPKEYRKIEIKKRLNALEENFGLLEQSYLHTTNYDILTHS